MINQVIKPKRCHRGNGNDMRMNGVCGNTGSPSGTLGSRRFMVPGVKRNAGQRLRVPPSGDGGWVRSTEMNIGGSDRAFMGGQPIDAR